MNTPNLNDLISPILEKSGWKPRVGFGPVLTTKGRQWHFLRGEGPATIEAIVYEDAVVIKGPQFPNFYVKLSPSDPDFFKELKEAISK